MAGRLDRIVRTLTVEIAHSPGDTGFPVSQFLNVVRKKIPFREVSIVDGRSVVRRIKRQSIAAKLGGDVSDLPDEIMDYAAKVWDFAIASGEVFVGPSGEWNHLTLHDVLALPEGEPTPDAATTPTLATKPKTKGMKRQTANGIPSTQPRLFITEELLWKTLAKHGINYKKIPRMEWQLLRIIASTLTTGILQTDLRKLSGQDKRSVPKRTDFLAAKGYITKRTTVERSFKTSRLWSVGYAPALIGGADIEDRLRMSKSYISELRGDMRPVFWASRWTGTSIDYESFGITFLSILKAYSVMRHIDLKTKMGISGIHWQMKVLAKECRKFAALGVLKYVAAVVQDDRKIWKDCIKYVRDPSSDEWDSFLATGKKSSVYTDASKDRLPKTRTPSKKQKAGAAQPAAANEDDQDDDSIAVPISATWTPEKPLFNILSDTVRRAGSKGISAPSASIATVGFSFRRYVYKQLEETSNGQNPPKHLQHLQLHRELVREGKTTSWMFTIGPSQAKASDQKGTPSPTEAMSARVVLPPDSQSAFGFPKLPKSLEKQVTGRSLSDLHRGVAKQHLPPRFYKLRKNRPWNSGVAASVASLPDSTTASSQHDLSQPIEPVEPVMIDAGNKEQQVVDNQPLVRIGKRHDFPSQVRPKNSLVMVIKSDRLKDPHFFSKASYDTRIAAASQTPEYEMLRAPVIELGDPISDSDDPKSPADQPVSTGMQFKAVNESTNHDGPLTPVTNGGNGDDASNAAGPAGKDPVKIQAPPKLEPRGKKRGKGRGKRGEPAAKRKRVVSGGYKCDKCGRTWKNDNGLAYHLTKANTPCNPNYQPPAFVPERIRKRRRDASLGLDDSSALMDGRQPKRARTVRNPSTRNGLTPILVRRPLLNSRAEPVSLSNYPTSEAADIIAQAQPGGYVASNMTVCMPIVKMDVSARDESEARNTPRKQRTHKRSGRRGRQSAVDPVSTPKAVSPARQLHGPLQGSTSRTSSIEPAGHGCDPPTPPPMPVLGDPTQTGEGGTQVLSEPEQLEVKKTSAHGEHGSRIPEFKMPKVPKNANGKTIKVAHIIRHFLKHSDGAFPGGYALWHAVLAVWLDTFKDDEPPAHQSFTTAKNRMADEGMAVEHRFHIKDAAGVSILAYVLIRPDVDFNAPVVRAIKAKMVASHPDVYIPAPFQPREDQLQKIRELGGQPPLKQSSRRTLDEKVEVLDKSLHGHIPLRQTPVFRPNTTYDMMVAAANDPLKQSRIAFAMNDREGYLHAAPKKQREHVEDFIHDLTAGYDTRIFVPRTPLPNSATRPPSPSPLLPPLRVPPPPPPLDETPSPIHPALLAGPGGFIRPRPPGMTHEEAQKVNKRAPLIDPVISLPPPPKPLAPTLSNPKVNPLSILPKSIGDIHKLDGKIYQISTNVAPQYARLQFDLEAIWRWERSVRNQGLSDSLLGPDKCGFLDIPFPGNHNCVPVPNLRWKPSNNLSPAVSPTYSAANESDIEEPPPLSLEYLQGPTAAQAALPSGPRGGEAQRGGRGQGRGGKGIRRTGGGGAGNRVPVFQVHRELTAYPQAPEDYMCPTGDDSIDWNAEDTWIAAFVAVRTLLGGVDRTVDWGLMLRLFQNHKLSRLRLFWKEIKKNRPQYIEKLTDTFQKAFIEAYDKGDLPPLDFDDVLAYDWRALIAWTLKLVLHHCPSLPASKAQLDAGFLYVEQTQAGRDWRENYFASTRSIWNRFQDTTSDAAALPLDEPHDAMDGYAITRSYVRALTCTPAANYSPATIKNMLLKMQAGGKTELSRGQLQELLDVAIKQLQHQRVIRDSRKSGMAKDRRFQLSDPYQNQLAKFCQRDKFLEAAQLKADLDKLFRNGGEYELAETCEDGAFMAIVNLQACGRVRFEAIDPPNVPFGFEPQNYMTRHYPKTYQYFRQRIVPTANYIFTDRTPPAFLSKVSTVPPPGLGRFGELPIWCDLFGNVDRLRWVKMLSAVIFMLAARGAMNARVTTIHLRPLAEVFEVQMILDWAEETGILYRRTADGPLLMAEWWWLAVAQELESVAPLETALVPRAPNGAQTVQP